MCWLEASLWCQHFTLETLAAIGLGPPKMCSFRHIQAHELNKIQTWSNCEALKTGSLHKTAQNWYSMQVTDVVLISGVAMLFMIHWQSPQIQVMTLHVQFLLNTLCVLYAPTFGKHVNNAIAHKSRLCCVCRRPSQDRVKLRKVSKLMVSWVPPPRPRFEC